MEDRAFEKYQRTIMKRRSMEAKSSAEVRRLHIVYFLSQKGGIEHPHLIRVVHLCRNGVRLRDIKRWLRELRGNDMPESYSWSYKRKYRTGYVWQDLQDDDLITPISDNEYVLKGSEIASAINNTGVSKVSIEKEGSCLDDDQKDTPEYHNQSHPFTHISTSEIEVEYPVFGSEASTLTDDSLNLETQKSIINNTDGIKQEKLDEKPSRDGIIDRPKKKKNKVKIDEKITKHAASSNSASVKPNFSKNKNCSHGVSSNMFRNMMSCGAINTDDSATVTINKNHRSFFNICSTDEKNVQSAETRKGDRKIGPPHRIYNSPWHQQQWSGRNNGVKDSTEDKEESKGQSRSSAAAYKPIYGPNCSQCGKPFNPEKLHAHMKSCKGMKALAKNVSVAKKIGQKSSPDHRNKDSVSGYFLTE
ncbi:protein SOSEKI 1-like [Primulina huaijiensis]|uniref:protein SOSEKI 1-like n=1 Tax=Primulina huaijiensis TaxID=1492673 RepID=UPI003CC70247